MLSTFFKSLIISCLVGLSYHGGREADEFLVIPLNYTHIPSAHKVVVEFKFGDEPKVRPCHIVLENPCHSVIPGCLCKQTSTTTELNITYRTSVDFEKRLFRTIIYHLNNTKIEGEWQHFPKINEPGQNDTDLKLDTNITWEVTKETLLHYQLGLGIPAAALIILILALTFFLITRGRQVKILKDQPIKFRYNDTESGRQDVSQDVNKRSQKMLNLTHDKDDHNENDRGLATVRTSLLGEDLPPRDAGTGRDDNDIYVNKIE